MKYNNGIIPINILLYNNITFVNCQYVLLKNLCQNVKFNCFLNKKIQLLIKTHQRFVQFDNKR